MTAPVVQVEIAGLPELKVSLRRLRKLEPMRAEVLEPAAKLGQAVARGAAPTGHRYNVQRDISRRVTARTSRVFVKDYRGRFIEYGRRAGAKLPPVKNADFQAWAESHGIPRSKLFVLARAIARRGVKGRFFMQKGREAVKAALPGYLRNCARALERLWGKG